MKIECNYDSDCPVKLEDAIIKNIADKTGVSINTIKRVLEIGDAFLEDVFDESVLNRIDKREKLKEDLKFIYEKARQEKKSLQEIHEDIDKANIKERLKDLGKP